MADETYSPKVYRANGGDKLAVASGGEVDIESGGALKLAGTAVARYAAQINALVQGVASGYKIARGQHITQTAADAIDTGLLDVFSVVASIESVPTLSCFMVQARISDQTGIETTRGQILIKSYKATSAADCTPIPATSFGKLVNWIAVGT